MTKGKVLVSGCEIFMLFPEHAFDFIKYEETLNLYYCKQWHTVFSEVFQVDIPKKTW